MLRPASGRSSICLTSIVVLIALVDVSTIGDAPETWTVSLAPGQYLFTCDVPFHVDRGMTGTFNVTP